MAHGPARRRGRFRTSQGGKGAIKSTRRPQNTEQTAPAPPPSPTPAAVTAPKGPWAHHHRNRHRCRFCRRQRWSAAVRRSSAPASCARLLYAQTFPRRLAALESEAARCHHPRSSPLSAASEPRPPAISTIARLVCVVAARGVGQQGGQEGLRRARDDADGGTDGGADARAATPNAADRTVALSDCRLQRNGWMVFTSSRRVGPVGSDDVVVFR